MHSPPGGSVLFLFAKMTDNIIIINKLNEYSFWYILESPRKTRNNLTLFSLCSPFPRNRGMNGGVSDASQLELKGRSLSRALLQPGMISTTKP
jgi:hypothetical protein